MSYHVTERQQKKTTHHPHGQQVVLYQISSIPDKTCRRLVQNWYRNEEIYILWNFIKRRYVCFLHFTAQSASRFIKKFQALLCLNWKLLFNRLHRGDVARFGSVFVQQNPTASTKSGDFGGNNPTSSNTVHESCTRFWSRPHFRGF